jgi:hypothetical protein
MRFEFLAAFFATISKAVGFCAWTAISTCSVPRESNATEMYKSDVNNTTTMLLMRNPCATYKMPSQSPPSTQLEAAFVTTRRDLT